MTSTGHNPDTWGIVSGDMDDDGVRPGWRLHLVCTVCEAEATYAGFVITQAADAAAADGWVLDYEALHTPARDRYATCPDHSG